METQWMKLDYSFSHDKSSIQCVLPLLDIVSIAHDTSKYMFKVIRIIFFMCTRRRLQLASRYDKIHYFYIYSKSLG